MAEPVGLDIALKWSGAAVTYIIFLAYFLKEFN
jgi:hypothetical protein